MQITYFPFRIFDMHMAYTSIETFVCVLWVSDLTEELTEQAYVNVLTRGDLSSLRWISSPLRHFVSSNSNVQLCRVYYSSLNFRDIMLATGKLPPDAIPGRECGTQHGALHFLGASNNNNHSIFWVTTVLILVLLLLKTTPIQK